MPDEPVVVQVMREFKQALLLREQGQMQVMARRWLEVEGALEDKITLLAQAIAGERAAGRAVKQWRLWRMESYRTLLAETQAEARRYQAWAADLITGEQRAYARLGIEQAAQAVQSALGGFGAYFTRLPVSAVEHMAGLAGDGSPLFAVLQKRAIAPAAVGGLQAALLRATALGDNPRVTARAMRDGLSQGLQKGLTIARTEQLRVYREASYRQYERTGLVEGFYRLAAHDARTCAACLAAEGEFYPLESGRRLADHPQGRCTMVPQVKGLPPVQFERGEAWLRRQPEETQRAILGPGRWQGWRDGDFDFADLAAVRHDPVWGDSIQVRSLTELTANGPAKTMGFSFFSGTAGTVAEARAIGLGPDGWEANERRLREQYLPRHRLTDDVERTIGLWGTPEPSFNAHVKGLRANVVAMAKQWGQDYDQQAMALLLPNPQGTGGKLVWDLGRQLDDSQLDALLRGLVRGNAALTDEFRRQHSLPDGWEVGLTVKQNRIAEYWAADSNQRTVGAALVKGAIRFAGLRSPRSIWRGGQDLKLLWKDEDY